MRFPAEFAKAGANLAEGSPALNAILRNWYDIIKASYDNLASPPAGSGVTAIVGGAIEGANGAGGYSLPGARVGDRKIFEFSFVESNNPKIQNSTCFEDVISVNDQVRQTNESDLQGTPFVVLFVR